MNVRSPSALSSTQAQLPTASATQKRQDKLNKRSKLFLDERIKVKQRIQSLHAFLLFARPEEAAETFQAHDDAIHALIFDGFTRLMEKLKVARADRPEKVSVSSKEIQELFGVLKLLTTFILFLPEKIRSGYQKGSLSTIIGTFVDPSNHHAVRLAGFKCLLTWLDVLCGGEHVFDELLRLFNMSIESELFPERYSKDHAAPIISPPIDHKPETHELFDTFLDNLAAISTGDTAVFEVVSLYGNFDVRSSVVTRLYRLFQAHFNAVLFEEMPPIAAVRSLTFFVNRYCLFSAPSEASLVLNSVILGQENVGMIFRLFEKNFHLPYTQTNVSRTTLNTLKIWSLLPMEEPILIGNLENDCDYFKESNKLTRKLLNIVAGLFHDADVDDDHIDAKISIFMDGLSFFRTIALEYIVPLEDETWDTLMDILLKIYEKSVCQKHQSQVASAIDNFLVSTILSVWVASFTKKETAWVGLKDVISSPNSISCAATITQWSKTMFRLTKVLAQHYCQSTYEIPDSNILSKRKSFSRPQATLPRPISAKNSRSFSRHDNPSMRASNKNLDVKETTSSTNELRVTSDAPSERYFRKSSYKSSLRNLDLWKPDREGASERITKNLTKIYDKVHEFSKIETLKRWDGEKALFAWRNMMCVLGNINDIVLPALHTQAIRSLVEIYDNLWQVRHLQSWKGQPSPPLNFFVTWMFQAAVKHDDFQEGRILAIGCMCRMMTRKFFGKADFPDIPADYFPVFYKILINILESRKENEFAAIVLNSKRIFHLNLPHIEILLKPFLDCIKFKFEDVKNPPDALIAQSSIAILSSIATLSRTRHNRFQNEYQTVITLMSDQLQMYFSRPPQTYSQTTHIILIQAVFLLLHHDLDALNLTAQKIIILELLFDHLKHDNLIVFGATADAIASLTQTSGLSSSIFEIENITKAIVEALDFHIAKTNAEVTSCIIDRLFSVLTQFLSILKAPSLKLYLDDILAVIEKAMSSSIETSMIKSSPEHSKTSTLFRSLSLSRKISDNFSERSPSMKKSLTSDLNSDFEPLKEAASNCLLSLLHHFDFFPVIENTAVLGTSITDPMLRNDEASRSVSAKDATLMFTYNNKTILTLHETAEDKIRVLARDRCSRYCWDFETVNCNHKTDETIENVYGGFQLNRNVRSKDQIEFKCVYEFDIIRFIETTSPECARKDGGRINFPQEPPKELHSELNQIRQDISSFGALQKRYSDIYSNIPVEMEQTENSVGLFMGDAQVYLQQKCHQKSSPSAEVSAAGLDDDNPSCGYFKRARSLFHALGFFDYSFYRTENETGGFQVLNQSQSFWRDIKGLDKKFGRECIKFGLIYVGPGQETEQAILQNHLSSVDISPDYIDFVKALGWEVDVATHPGFLGGLEKNQVNGNKAVYYADAVFELIFHDVTKMPNDPADPKQVKKKRHIGNDQIHIIWNEHFRQYKHETIKGDFGNVQIIINPVHSFYSKEPLRLPQKLYSIDIYADAGIPSFGPLQNGFLVHGSILPSLVRATAIHAYRAVIQQSQLPNDPKLIPQSLAQRHPYSQRGNDFCLVSTRHRQDNERNQVDLGHVFDYSDFLKHIYFLQSTAKDERDETNKTESIFT